MKESVTSTHVTVVIALLCESCEAKRTGEFRLDAALVILMSPQRSEEAIDFIAFGADVFLLDFLLRISLVVWRRRIHIRSFLRRGLLLDSATLVRDGFLVALEDAMSHQRSLNGEFTSAIRADVLLRTPGA